MQCVCSVYAPLFNVPKMCVFAWRRNEIAEWKKRKKRSARTQTTQSFEHWTVCWHMNKHAMPCIPNWMCVCELYIYTNAAARKTRLALRILVCWCSIAIQRNRYTSTDINSVELMELFYGIAAYFLMVNHLTLFSAGAWDCEFSFTSRCFSVRVCFDSEFSIEMSTACLHAYEVCFSFPWYSQFNSSIHKYTHQVCVLAYGRTISRKW